MNHYQSITRKMKFTIIVQTAMYPNTINAHKVNDNYLACGYRIKMCVVKIAIRMKCAKYITFLHVVKNVDFFALYAG